MSAQQRVVHRFLGLNATEWEAAEGLPEWSDVVSGPVTVEDVTAGIVAMLRRLDAEVTP